MYGSHRPSTNRGGMRELGRVQPPPAAHTGQLCVVGFGGGHRCGVGPPCSGHTAPVTSTGDCPDRAPIVTRKHARRRRRRGRAVRGAHMPQSRAPQTRWSPLQSRVKSRPRRRRPFLPVIGRNIWPLKSLTIEGRAPALERKTVHDTLRFVASGGNNYL